MPSKLILAVDDAQDTLELIQRNLSAENYSVLTATCVADAIEILNSRQIDLVITDMKMPKTSGLDLVKHVRANFKSTEVMMITGYATVEGAIKAVKAGSEEFLTKPFTSEELSGAVKRALDKQRARRKVSDKSQQTGPLPGFIGQSQAIKQIYALIAKAARTAATVLICGESGTGKELVARAIHYSGPRNPAPFVPVNCGAIPDELLESELFGYLKGSFTGANESRAGFFQTADGGTIFLDEVSETSPSMQVKLLRVLQEKEVYMVGARKPQKVNVRIIAATNKDLALAVKKGGFREDLFFRLNVITISVPPLRERGDDIFLLINTFASKYAGESGKKAPQFSDQALEALRSYNWPGNVRELENVIQRLMVMSEDDVIEAADLPSLMKFSALCGPGSNKTLAEVEAAHIRTVLAGAGGNKSKAAQILGIDRKTLREHLKHLSITE